MFNEAETEADPDEDAGAGPEVIAVHLPATPLSVTPNKPGRKPLPAHLPRIEVIVELAEDEARCVEDGSTLKVIGEEITEQLDIIPAQIGVRR
ncbi:MAG: transposase [Candidatus Azotimanducaceae bacterium]